MSKGLIELNGEKISSMVGGVYSPEQLAIIKNQVLKGSTDTELAHFAMVCKTTGLNPFRKEIWGYKDNKGNLIIFAGRDGFLVSAQRDPLFGGLRSCSIRENDQYEIDVAMGIVKHKLTELSLKKRGPIVGAFCIAFRKNCEPTVEVVSFESYYRDITGPWKTHPDAMIQKVAETNALKKAFGISGVSSEYDFTVNNNIAAPIDTTVSVLATLEQALAEIKSITDIQTLDAKYKDWEHLHHENDWKLSYTKKYHELEGTTKTN